MSTTSLNATFSAACLASQRAGEQARGARVAGPKRCVIRCQAEDTERSATLNTRRAMLAGVGSLALSLNAASSKAAYGNYKVVCDPTEDGADCRRDTLAKDNLGQNLDYDKITVRGVDRTSSTASRNPAGFEPATKDLIVKMRLYNDLTPFDKQRPVLAAELQKEGNAWVSKYAPGGSCKNESCRDMYSALNSLLGHLAFNGLAPMRSTMVAQIEKNFTATLDLMEKGR